MAYKRYDGLVNNLPQKKIDKELQICPLCGQQPHWLLEIEQGFSIVKMKSMCEKCNAKLYSEYNGFFKLDNLRVIDTGGINKSNLSLNSIYHIESLKTIANNIDKSLNNDNYPINTTQTNYSGYEGQEPKKNVNIVAGSIFSVIIFIALMVWILMPIGGSVGTLTYENYMSINNGMSYSQVCDIFDSNGELSSTAGMEGYTLSYYTWSNEIGTRIVVVSFENGRVTGKSQVGLT